VAEEGDRRAKGVHRRDLLGEVADDGGDFLGQLHRRLDALSEIRKLRLRWKLTVEKRVGHFLEAGILRQIEMS
jgi:hypothetical protein